MHRSLLMWTIILGFELLAVLAFVSNEWLLSQIDREMEQVEAWMGRARADRIFARTDAAFTAAFKDTGAVESSIRFVLPSALERDHSVGLETLGAEMLPWIADRVRTLWTTVYQMMFRFFSVMSWAPLAAVMLIPASIDGLMMRRIKRWTFGYSGPVRYHTAMHTLFAVFFIFLGYLLWPGAVVPIATPIIIMVVAIAVSTLSANFQKYT